MANLAPVAPEAGLSLGLILLAIACVTLIALSKFWKFTFGAMLTTLANLFDSIGIPIPFTSHTIGLSAVGSAFKDVDSWVLNAIGSGITWSEKGLHAVLGAMTWLLQQMAEEIAGLAEDVAKAHRILIGSTIPGAIHAVTDPIWRELGAIEQRFTNALAQPAQVIHRTTDVIAPGLKALEGQVNALEAKVVALGAAASSAVSHAPSITIIRKPGVIGSDISRGLDSLWKRVREFGRILTPAGILGLAAGAVLSGLGLSWLKCRNVENTAKKLCGTNVHTLDSLLAGLLSIFGLVSLVEFAHFLQPAAKELGTEVTHFWRADVQGVGRDRQVGSPSLD